MSSTATKKQKTNSKSGDTPDVLSTEVNPAAFMDLSRDLVLQLESIIGRGATLRIHRGGREIGMTVWVGRRNVGYVDARALVQFLQKSLIRWCFLDPDGACDTNRTFEIFNEETGVKLGDFLTRQLEMPNFFQPETRGAGLQVVTTRRRS
jgi:hypothetical protein